MHTERGPRARHPGRPAPGLSPACSPAPACAHTCHPPGAAFLPGLSRAFVPAVFAEPTAPDCARGRGAGWPQPRARSRGPCGAGSPERRFGGAAGAERAPPPPGPASGLGGGSGDGAWEHRARLSAHRLRSPGVPQPSPMSSGVPVLLRSEWLEAAPRSGVPAPQPRADAGAGGRPRRPSSGLAWGCGARAESRRHSRHTESAPILTSFLAHRRAGAAAPGKTAHRTGVCQQRRGPGGQRGRSRRAAEPQPVRTSRPV